MVGGVDGECCWRNEKRNFAHKEDEMFEEETFLGRRILRLTTGLTL